MAAKAKSNTSSVRTTFGKKSKKGAQKSKFGPKENKPKQYKGQGR